MGPTQQRLLHKAIHYPGWHCFAPDMQSVIDKLVKYGLIEVKKMQYRLIGNEKLFQMQQDINDMNAARQTQFGRCHCGHLYELSWGCGHCVDADNEEVDGV